VAFRPSLFAKSLSERRDAAFDSASSSVAAINTPIFRSLCCARAAIGHATVAPPSSVMNSRRFIR
jgi:hypothetical protein